ncbi:BEL1-like homeodomain protein 7 isoform X1 [Quercus robur]|uniref:BEL1-like homeodomain protein 7 isoform X1 n=2 Tax=Quercus robur TaxID=38942 RepID=UPI00216328EC|nr:BEL1-like homeodomain protein 7 isoform X1 [Quercus robur]XP_050267563.1 BEL1-like homeodomain protein 7 isoform X1 [Quercus robur]XP_050267564.1 BEL1-like homeodomain protein 7 isoform X1 [Quercus robur]
MATYFPNASNQRDCLQTPYLGDQKFASYSEAPFHPNNIMMYMNQASSGSYSDILSGSSLPPNCDESVGGRNEMMFIPPIDNRESMQSIDARLNAVTGDHLGNSVTGNSQVIPRRQLGVPDGEQNIQSQGLSLSLCTQMPSAVSVASFGSEYPNPGLSSFLGNTSCKGDENNRYKDLRSAECLLSGFPGGSHNTTKPEALCNPHSSMNPKEMLCDQYLYEPSAFATTILNSRYLKASQHLLDEVVNVRKALKQRGLNKHQIQGIGLDVSKEADGRSNTQSVQMSSDPGESTTNSSCELSPAERQDLQNKKTTLLSMLDEVDKRYRQYYHQMQIVVSSFVMVAGCGAAEPYTALALQTISRHFRSLRDTIASQIQVIQRSLGEQDTSPNGQGGIPRLRYVDQQLRQQRALQQFGVMRHAWRPQRGLPENSVSILRAWLFEHFLHPYPKDSEKIILARQTGLTRNQVANWFINARVRLWKPMVEEMYKEEFAESEMNSKSSPESALNVPRDNSLASEDRGEELQDSVISTTADSVHLGQAYDSKSVHIPNVEINGQSARIGFESSTHRDNVLGSGIMKLQGNQRPKVDDHNLYSDEIILPQQNGGGSLMAAAATYDMSELGSFVDGSQVSLALELRHCENDGFPMSGGANLRGNDTVTSSAGPESLDFQCMDLGKQHHRFNNPHMLHDFVV